jgi:hypothetical protein
MFFNICPIDRLFIATQVFAFLHCIGVDGLRSLFVQATQCASFCVAKKDIMGRQGVNKRQGTRTKCVVLHTNPSSLDQYHPHQLQKELLA